MGFGMYPGTNWPVPTPDGFPNFIQFQEDGVNLGGPDADTLNFTGNVSVTRGEGENANVVTVDVPASSSGATSGSSVLAVWLETEDTATFNRDAFTAWNGTTVVAGTDAEWDNTAKAVSILVPGVYKFEVRGVAEPDPFSTGNWPGNVTLYGTEILVSGGGNTPSMYSRTDGNYSGSVGNDIMKWSDVFLIQIDEAGLVEIGLYAQAYDAEQTTPVLFSADLIVTRLGDVTA
jgi:hypothetical protein